ncbi:MAG: iron-containing alcohol dehydrogenase [Spirochaetes bacterium]|nr:iron-containing alcohol dehydrogenase [Spirochaetota bacterium]
MESNIIPDFHLPTKIFVKPDILKSTGKILSEIGSRAIIISTAEDIEKLESSLDRLVSTLRADGIFCLIYDEIPAVPNTEFIDSAVYFAKKTSCDMIIGFGGTESINAAKAVALLTSNFNFCEEIFDFQGKLEKPVPLVTIPSHPIFGFELLPVFYMNDIHSSTKKVYTNNMLYPHFSILDPAIPSPAYEHEIGPIGMSAIALAAESLISQNINEFTNTYALKAIDLTFRHLVPAFKDPHNIHVRTPLLTASILAGIAFSTCYLSISLSIGLAMSSRTNIPLSHSIAVLLPHVMEYNLTAAPGRYVQMAKVMDEDVREITVIEAAIKAIEAIRRLEIEVDIPQRISQFGISKTEFSPTANLAMTYPFTYNAPRSLNRDEIETILIAAY